MDIAPFIDFGDLAPQAGARAAPADASPGRGGDFARFLTGAGAGGDAGIDGRAGDEPPLLTEAPSAESIEPAAITADAALSATNVAGELTASGSLRLESGATKAGEKLVALALNNAGGSYLGDAVGIGAPRFAGEAGVGPVTDGTPQDLSAQTFPAGPDPIGDAEAARALEGADSRRIGTTQATPGLSVSDLSSATVQSRVSEAILRTAEASAATEQRDLAIAETAEADKIVHLDAAGDDVFLRAGGAGEPLSDAGRVTAGGEAPTRSQAVLAAATFIEDLRVRPSDLEGRHTEFVSLRTSDGLVGLGGETVAKGSAAGAPSSGSPATALAAAAAGQVAAAVSSNAAQDEIQVQLDPPELGNLVIKLHFSEAGQLSALVSAEHEATRALMKAHEEELRAAMAAAGFENASFDFTQSDHNARDNAPGAMLAAFTDDADAPLAMPAAAEMTPSLPAPLGGGVVWSDAGLDVRV